MPLISRYLQNDAAISEKLPILAAPLRFVASYADNKLSYRRETARRLRTSFSARSLIVHFTEHRIYCTTIIDKVVSTLSANKPSPYT